MKRILLVFSVVIIFLSGSFCPPTETQFVSGKVTCTDKNMANPFHCGSFSGYSILLFADGKKVAETMIDSNSSYQLFFTLLDQKRFNYYITDSFDTLLLRSDTLLNPEGGETMEEEITRNFSLPKFYTLQNQKAIRPVCGKSDQAAEIVYGDGVAFNSKRKIIAGGCIVSPISPHWYCDRDKVRY